MPFKLRPSMGRSRGLVAPVQNHGVKFLQQFFRRIIFPDLGVADKFDSLGLRQNFQRRSTTSFLSSFMFGNAIHEQTAGTVRALENRDPMAGLVQLRRSAQSRRAGTDDGDFFAGALLWRFGRDPAFVPALSMISHSMFLMVTGGALMPKHARTFARRGTDAAGEFGKIIGLVQAVQRLAPEAAINQVVPFGNQIVDRAAAGHAADELAGVAERNSAIHAARALFLEVGFGRCK
jgi:hypothetical protein